MTVEGSGAWIRNAESSGALLTARFIVDGAQTIGSTALEDVLWLAPATVADTSVSWDDIGFPSDYTTNGQFLFPEDGEYFLAAYASVDGGNPLTAGEGYAGIQFLSGATFDEKLFTPLMTGHGPALHIAAGRRFYSGNDLTVQVQVNGADAGGTIGPASMYIVKIGSPTLP